MKTENGKTKLAFEIVEKYIALALKHNRQYSKKELGKILWMENPDIFIDAEDGRHSIRIVTNADGTKKRKELKKYDDIARQFALIPEAIKEYETSEPFIIPSACNKALFVADFHGRFYDKRVVEIAINDGIKNNCNCVVIPGDFFDFYQDSKFDKNPELCIELEEREWGQDMLKLLQDTFGYVVLKMGNHDERRERHIGRLAMTKPELMQMAKFSDYCFFDGCSVNFVEAHRHVMFGKLNTIHGHEYFGGGGIHVAYNRLHKAFDSIVSAHSHKSQSNIKSDINGNVFGSWTLGCMCNLYPKYTPKNEWTNGHGIAEKDNDGEFSFENKVIFKNRIFSV